VQHRQAFLTESAAIGELEQSREAEFHVKEGEDAQIGGMQ
jgi:hypothetical protein